MPLALSICVLFVSLLQSVNGAQLLIIAFLFQLLATNWIIFVCFFSCNIIKFNYFLHYFVILLHLVSSFSHNKTLLAPYAYVSSESIHFIILSSLALNTILLTSSVNALYFSLLNLR